MKAGGLEPFLIQQQHLLGVYLKFKDWVLTPDLSINLQSPRAPDAAYTLKFAKPCVNGDCTARWFSGRPDLNNHTETILITTLFGL